MVEAVGFGELTDVAPVAVTAVVARLCWHGSLVIPGRQSQTVDVAGTRPLLAGEVAGEVAVDEHEAASRVAASSPAATAANRETWCFAPDLDRQVTRCLPVL
ncbi:MAG TPA: hypothetical protein VK280_06145 [Streptosporangiaceae bacterium]|nr:hypothetical protein [Streptosporangiaceae bacterium]